MRMVGHLRSTFVKIVLVLLIAMSASSCKNEDPYQKGYQDGLSAGRASCAQACADQYNNGYGAGYREGYDKGFTAIFPSNEVNDNWFHRGMANIIPIIGIMKMLAVLIFTMTTLIVKSSSSLERYGKLMMALVGFIIVFLFAHGAVSTDSAFALLLVPLPSLFMRVPIIVGTASATYILMIGANKLLNYARNHMEFEGLIVACLSLMIHPVGAVLLLSITNSTLLHKYLISDVFASVLIGILYYMAKLMFIMHRDTQPAR